MERNHARSDSGTCYLMCSMALLKNHVRHRLMPSPVLRIPNVFRGEIDLTDLSWVKLTSDEQRKYELGFG